jgi:hypothetical protein
VAPVHLFDRALRRDAIVERERTSRLRRGTRVGGRNQGKQAQTDSDPGEYD